MRHTIRLTGLLSQATVFLAMVVVIQLLLPSVAEAQEADRAAAVLQYLDAAGHDVDAAAAMFADDAVLISTGAGANCPAERPCDLAGIRRRLQRNSPPNLCTTLTELRVEGAVVTGRFEVRYDGIRRNGVEHLAIAFMALVPQDKITFMVELNDVADADMARYLAIRTGTGAAGAPIPNPDTPCAALQ